MVPPPPPPGNTNPGGGSGEKSPAGEMGYRGKPPVELNGKSIIMK